MVDEHVGKHLVENCPELLNGRRDLKNVLTNVFALALREIELVVEPHSEIRNVIVGEQLMVGFVE